MRQEMMGFWDAASDGPYANSLTSLQADNQANILQLNFYRLDAPLPDAQPTVPKHSLKGMSLYLFYFILFMLLIYFSLPANYYDCCCSPGAQFTKCLTIYHKIVLNFW